MNKFILCLIVSMPIAASAQKISTSKQVSSAKQIEYNSRTNFPTLLKFEKAKAPLFNVGDDAWAKEILPISSEEQMKFKSAHQNENLNQSIYKYQQYYKNIPVEFAILNLKVVENKILSVAGDYNENISPSNTVSISGLQSISYAKQAVPAEVYKWERKNEEQELKQALNKPDFSFDPNPTLVILPIQSSTNREFKYAYKLDIFTHKPLSRYNVYIDAQTGEVLRKVSVICSIDTKSTANTRYVGTQSIMSDSISPNNFVLREKNRKGRGMQIETRNCKTLFENDAVDFTSTSNVWSMSNVAKDEAALDCHHSAESTYDYYYDSLNYNSYDGAGSKLLQYVHYDLNYFNAFWTGSYSCYGDGKADPLTYIDVVSHEITHGVTQFTAGLEYASESGAMNESFSDIFGTVVEFNELGSAASWNIGTRTFTLRDMSNPNRFNNPDTYGGDAWTNTKDCIPDGNNDYCGVHNNSGVQNFWFYVLSEGDTGINDLKNPYQVVGIGINKAAKIAFKSLRDYLTPQSDYLDARRGSIEAAIDLYGNNSQEVQSVMNAWHAVGVGKRYTYLPDTEFKAEKMYCEPNSVITFVNNTGNGLSYHWDFGDGTTSTDVNPTHAYSSVGNYNVTLIATNINGSDTLFKPNYIKIFTDGPIASTCAATTLLPIGTTGIYRVEFGGIDNPSAGPKDETPYMDFNCYRANVARSAFHPMKITTYPGSPVFTRVYIDWNNNGSFDMPDELAMSTNNTVQYHYDTVYVPSSAVPNIPLRMRVVSAKTTNNTPDVVCSGLRNGQIEDYSVIVTTGAGVDNNFKVLFNVSPNPADNELFINSTEEYHRLMVYDLLGREMLNSVFYSSLKLDISKLKKGIYILKLETNGIVEMKKIIVN